MSGSGYHLELRALNPGLLAFVLLVAGGCSRSPSLVDTPVLIKGTPAIVRFSQPVRLSGTGWELCFEFNPQGDSLQAGRIEALLVATSGQRYRFVESELDRRGEAVVCRVGQLARVEGGGQDQSASEPIEFEAVELSSDIPLGVRQLRGGSLP